MFLLLPGGHHHRSGSLHLNGYNENEEKWANLNVETTGFPDSLDGLWWWETVGVKSPQQDLGLRISKMGRKNPKRGRFED